MSLVLGFETYPYYAQVALFDQALPNAYPQWATGTEEAVFATSGIVVATQPDDFGEVRIEVWHGQYSPNGSLRLIGSGAVRVSNDRLVVGSVTGNDLREVQLGAGVYRVSVYVRDAEHGPETVVFSVQSEMDAALGPPR